jgi:YegS/Rv2252/BmrU family lipid kinase
MKNVFFIVNPCSGKGLIRRHLLSILDIFSKNEMNVTVSVTQEQRHAYKTVQEKAGLFDLVVCSGGDGTLDEVVSGLLRGGHDCPVGYIPAGSTNDFAHSLRLPSNMEAAATIITQNYPFACDVGFFNEKVFVYVAAFGVFTDVSYKTNQDMKNSLGHLAYILEGTKSIFNIKAYQMRIETDHHVLEGRFIYGMVTNSESVGGFKNLTGKDVKLDDGLFELVLIREPVTPLDWEPIISGLLSGESDEKFIYFLKSSRVHIEAEESVAWTLDGEDGGEHLEVDIRNDRKRLQIMVDKKKYANDEAIE